VRQVPYTCHVKTTRATSNSAWWRGGRNLLVLVVSRQSCPHHDLLFRCRATSASRRVLYRMGQGDRRAACPLSRPVAGKMQGWSGQRTLVGAIRVGVIHGRGRACVSIRRWWSSFRVRGQGVGRRACAGDSFIASGARRRVEKNVGWWQRGPVVSSRRDHAVREPGLKDERVARMIYVRESMAQACIVCSAQCGA